MSVDGNKSQRIEGNRPCCERSPRSSSSLTLGMISISKSWKGICNVFISIGLSYDFHSYSFILLLTDNGKIHK